MKKVLKCSQIFWLLWSSYFCYLIFTLKKDVVNSSFEKFTVNFVTKFFYFKKNYDQSNQKDFRAPEKFEC